MPENLHRSNFRTSTLLLLAFFAGAVLACAQTTVAEWQKEAVRKYPELGRADSELNKKFTDATTAARVSRPQFFDDPKWPMILADEINAPPVVKGPIADPLLRGAKRVVDSRALYEASAKKLEEAVQTRDAKIIDAACQKFLHESPVLRAQAKTLAQATTDAARELVAAEQFRRQSVDDVARLRRNAMLARIPNSLTPDDPAKAKRAVELKESADELEKKVERRSKAAKQSFEDCLQGLLTLVQKAREPELAKPVEAQPSGQ